MENAHTPLTRDTYILDSLPLTSTGGPPPPPEPAPPPTSALPSTDYSSGEEEEGEGGGGGGEEAAPGPGDDRANLMEAIRKAGKPSTISQCLPR